MSDRENGYQLLFLLTPFAEFNGVVMNKQTNFKTKFSHNFYYASKKRIKKVRKHWINVFKI